MGKIIITIVCILTLSAFADSKKEEKHHSKKNTKQENKKTAKHAHREHDAHEHGSAQMSMAFDNTKGKLEFKGAAEGILGFEHKATSPNDQKTLKEAIAYFENKIGKMVQFDEALKCQFSKELIEQSLEAGDQGTGQHSEWVANFNIVCEKSPLGTKLIIDLSNFKLLKDLDITILVDSIQKSAEFKGKPLIIELK